MAPVGVMDDCVRNIITFGVLRYHDVPSSIEKIKVQAHFFHPPLFLGICKEKSLGYCVATNFTDINLQIVVEVESVLLLETRWLRVLSLFETFPKRNALQSIVSTC